MFVKLARRTAVLITLLISAVTQAQTTLHAINVFGARDARSAGDVDGDGVADIVVGSPGTSQLSCIGSAGYVHVYSGRTGAELYGRPGPPSQGGPADAFGWSVDGVGDVDGDGLSEFIVGAPLFGPATQCGEGAALICSGLDGSTLRTLVPPGAAPGYCQFGVSVAGIGDINLDGVPDVAVGSEYGQNSFGVQSGYVALFSGLDGSVLHMLWGNWNNERFGACCAPAGDVNGDGYPDVLVGTPYYSYPTGMGGVRVYSGQDGLLLSFVTGTGSTRIGYGVGSLGDLNLDGTRDFITGTGFNFQTPSGASVYSGQTGSVLHTFVAQPGDSGGGGPVAFPHPVGGAGDFNGDGVPDLLIATVTGASIYSGANWSLLLSHPTLASNPSSVSVIGDLNADGRPDFVVAWPTPTGGVHVVLSGCPEPAVYCSGKLNSIGCTPTITSTGVLSYAVGNDDFYAVSQNTINGTNGMLLWSSSPTSLPFFGGTLCVGSSIVRTPVQNSGGSVTGMDCTGSFSFHFSRAHASAHAVSPGTRIYAQFWSRDPGYSPPNNVSLTNGLSFTVCP